MWFEIRGFHPRLPVFDAIGVEGVAQGPLSSPAAFWLAG